MFAGEVRRERKELFIETGRGEISSFCPVVHCECRHHVEKHMGEHQEKTERENTEGQSGLVAVLKLGPLILRKRRTSQWWAISVRALLLRKGF